MCLKQENQPSPLSVPLPQPNTLFIFSKRLSESAWLYRFLSINKSLWSVCAGCVRVCVVVWVCVCVHECTCGMWLCVHMCLCVCVNT